MPNTLLFVKTDLFRIHADDRLCSGSQFTLAAREVQCEGTKPEAGFICQSIRDTISEARGGLDLACELFKSSLTKQGRCMRFVTVAVTVALLISAGCGKPTVPCGGFTFSGTPKGQFQMKVAVDFSSNPSACGASCSCNKIAWVQIVRIIDIASGDFLAPNSDQANRTVTGQADATLNGWAVDRVSNRKWGYFGRFDDGTFDSDVIVGSNSTPAILTDEPGWMGPDNTWFDFVTVPVCIDSEASCNNRLLGLYYWLFTVQAGGGTGGPFNEIGVDWNVNSFNAAVAMWNSQAPGLGKNSFPSMSPL